MVVFHPGPGSYTGEDTAEISCHGNPLIVSGIGRAIGATGLARMAERGEFTRRAFLNGKIDLTQAEAVGALVTAGSTAGVDMAENLLSGGLSRRVKGLTEGISEIISKIEASFIIDDIEMGSDTLERDIIPLIGEIESLVHDAPDASPLISGIITTIAGLPNAGKSSLFNAILGYERAIVHQESGTTRDIISERITISGFDFIFHDTAGIRDTPSGPERIGVERTIESLKGSDLVLYVVDAVEGLRPEEEQWLCLGKKTIVVMNKTDLLERGASRAAVPGRVWVSALNKDGMPGLMEAMTGLFPRDLPEVFIERHIYLLSKALERLKGCLRSARDGLTPDALVIDLRETLEYISEITGKIVTDDILDRIFSSFCVGK